MGLLDLFCKPTLSATQTILPATVITKIENGGLADLRVDTLMLKNGEKCHYVDKTYHVIEKAVTRNIRRTRGISTPPGRVFKKVRSYSSTSISMPVTEKRTEYVPGYLYITNQRVIFTSKNRGVEKQLRSLSAIIPYSNAIGMQFGQSVHVFLLPRSDLAVKTLHMLQKV